MDIRGYKIYSGGIYMEPSVSNAVRMRSNECQGNRIKIVTGQ